MKYHIVAFGVFLIDQLTKYLIAKKMVLGSRVVVIPGFADFVFVRNKGGVFGLFQSGGDIITVLSVATLFVVSFFYAYSIRNVGGYLSVGLALVMAGAFGNILDRIRFDYVIDFIQLHIGNLFTWHTFNVADASIVIGAVMLVIYSFSYGKEREREKVDG